MPNLSALLAEGERLMPAAERHQRPLGAPDRADLGFRIERPKALDDDELADPDDDGAGVSTEENGSGPTKLYIYSDIGGWFGVWPEEIIAELSSIPGDIELHLHSPGGDAFDGIAIYNAFRQHPGKIHGSVDGLAASAASVIAMACDDLKMSKGAQLMIHDAWGFAQGPQADMEKMGQFLGKISNSIADIYAEKAGGDAEGWRVAMKEESWYTDKEAVEAGLADRIETSAAAAKNHWDLKVFNHAGREKAPKPPMPGGRRADMAGRGVGVQIDYAALERMAREDAEQGQRITAAADALRAGKDVTPAQAAALIHAAAQRADARTQTPVATPANGPSKEESSMAHDPAKIREALGLGPDATDEQVQTAWAQAYAAPAPTPAPTPPAENGTTPALPDPTYPGQTTGLAALAESARKQGVVLIDPSQLAEMQQMARLGMEAHQTLRRDQRDAVINSAVKDGKIALSRVKHWQDAWDADPEGTRQLLDSMSPNLVPVEALGYAGSVTNGQDEAAYLGLYPEDKEKIRRG